MRKRHYPTHDIKGGKERGCFVPPILTDKPGDRLPAPGPLRSIRDAPWRRYRRQQVYSPSELPRKPESCSRCPDAEMMSRAPVCRHDLLVKFASLTAVLLVLRFEMHRLDAKRDQACSKTTPLLRHRGSLSLACLVCVSHGKAAILFDHRLQETRDAVRSCSPR